MAQMSVYLWFWIPLNWLNLPPPFSPVEGSRQAVIAHGSPMGVVGSVVCSVSAAVGCFRCCPLPAVAENRECPVSRILRGQAKEKYFFPNKSQGGKKIAYPSVQQLSFGALGLR